MKRGRWEFDRSERRRGWKKKGSGADHSLALVATGVVGGPLAGAGGYGSVTRSWIRQGDRRHSFSFLFLFRQEWGPIGRKIKRKSGSGGGAAVGDEVEAGGFVGREGVGEFAVEAVTDAEAVAGELENRGDGFAGVGAAFAEERDDSVGRAGGERVGALVGNLAAEMDAVGAGAERERHAAEEHLGRGFAGEFGFERMPETFDRVRGGHGRRGEGREAKGEGAGAEG